MNLTPDREKEITQVNLDVNTTVKWESDSEVYGRPDFWEVADKVGDCDDFVLRKRQELIAKGWDAKTDLGIGIGTFNDRGKKVSHAVLIARTDQGDYVLDNRDNRIKAWNGAGLDWYIHQEGKEWKYVNKPVKVQPDRRER